MGLETMVGLGVMSSLLTTTMNIGNAQSLNVQNFQQQKKLMQYQDELNANRWNEQFNTIANYNTPKNQIGRLQDAGVNPLFDSQFGGQTSASIGANTSLPSYSPSIPQIDLSNVMSTLAQSFFNDKSLKLDERRVKALEQKTGSEIENNTNMTNSEIKVNLKKLEVMDMDKDKSATEIAHMKTDMQSIKESIKQNWFSVLQNEDKVAQGWADLGIKKYTSDWQKELGNLNARISSYDAGTRRQQVQLAERSFQFEKGIKNKEYRLNVQKFEADLRNQKIDSFIKIMDKTTHNILGFKSFSPRMIADANALMTAFVNTMDNMDARDFTKIAPKCVNMMNYLQSTVPYYPLKLGSKPSSWDGYAPKNAQDGF